MTTEAPLQFFSDPDNQRLLLNFSQNLQLMPADAVKPSGVVENLNLAINLIISNSQKFDELCTSNIYWIGKNLLNQIDGVSRISDEKKSESIRYIFISVYRFICELEFMQPGDSSYEINGIMNFVQENLNYFSGRDRQQIIYATTRMPAQIMKRLISHPSIKDLRVFADTVDSSRKLKEEWDVDLRRREELTEALSQNLKNIASEYNFVGLVNGFQSLHGKKDKERKFSLFWLLVIAVLMILAPAIQISFVVDKIELIERHKLTLAYTLPMIIAIEVILLYFFRVLLSHFRSVKAQLLQLDMRIALCQFIESYAEYASKIKSQDPAALSKFEALIFSGLVPDESSIPSTFDGAEQIASLINSIRGGGKG